MCGDPHPAVEIDPVFLPEFNVENQAVRAEPRFGGQELGGRREGFDATSGTRQQPPHRAEQRTVVVDNTDGRSVPVRAQRCLPAKRGGKPRR